jgi:hypothetical protein
MMISKFGFVFDGLDNGVTIAERPFLGVATGFSYRLFTK